ncbi:HAD family hydrolase [Dyella terrae]|uniref:HAD family hydrolase n=1 Tax=Dyella terrae TaxID=522259 RepID=UPI001EFE86F9|nr:HAD hydrolase-like protein [Dyella terrae]ULU23633.1 HAD hydrolase-like protein [Dyella terrae]
MKPHTHTERVAIFDLDGTLVDSVDGITNAVNRSLQTNGITPLQRDEAIPLLGDGLAAFGRRAYALRGASPSTQDIDDFLQDYLNHPPGGAALYPNVRVTLDHLARSGWRLAVCTNKIEAAALALLDNLNVLDRFDVVCGGDTVERQKPDAGHIHGTLQRAGLTGLPAVMIGDNLVDLAAASAHGIPAIFASWGYGRLPPDVHAPFTATQFSQLPQLLDAATAQISP